jgi:hypothetical protein
MKVLVRCPTVDPMVEATQQFSFSLSVQPTIVKRRVNPLIGRAVEKSYRTMA